MSEPEYLAWLEVVETRTFVGKLQLFESEPTALDSPRSSAEEPSA